MRRIQRNPPSSTVRAKLSAKEYGAPEVRLALCELFDLKCAYCEASLGTGMHVDHYRPKARVAGCRKTSAPAPNVRDHTGYTWLEFDWENLFPACLKCNTRLKCHRSGISGGKGDFFPLSDEDTRVYDETEDLDNEARLLLNPCLDDPDQHLQLGPNGEVSAKELGSLGEVSEMGLASIKYYHLKWYIQRRDRESKLKALKRAVRRADLETVTELLADDAPFCGLLRAYFKGLVARGVWKVPQNWRTMLL